MSDGFTYRPKFVDIRVRKPPSPVIEDQAAICQHPGCSAEATCRAPKSRDDPDDVRMFCTGHAALYNRNWNWFAGMDAADWAAHQAAAAHGHRPTWGFRGNPQASSGGRRRPTAGAAERAAAAPRPASGPVRGAFETLGLGEAASREETRQAYAELVRRYHPDANGGDRSAESRLNAVVKAYKILKTARRA